MARYYSENVPRRRNVVAILAIASSAAAISAFQYLLARVEAGFAAFRKRAVADDVHNRELQRILKQPGASPRGLFDPLFSGLSADAAAIDAAICRRARLW
jgi:hypothetical protein